MYRRRSERKIEVTVGEGVVVLRREGERDVRQANVLGTLRDADGRCTLYLDRFVHGPEDAFAGWSASGAITTILSQCSE